MKVNSMDATFRPTVNIEPSPTKQDAPANLGSRVEIQPGTQARDVSYVMDREGSNTQAQAEDKISDTFLQSSIDKVNHTFEMQRRSVRYKIHDRTNEVMVKIVDAETEEVIREIPPEKLLDMFANMLEMAGLLVDERR